MAETRDNDLLRAGLRLVRPGAALALAGVGMVLLAVLSEDRAEVSVALVILGSALMALGFFGERVEGDIELGARGLRAELVRTVRMEATERGLSDEQVEQAISLLRADLDVLTEDHRRRSRRELLDVVVRQPPFQRAQDSYRRVGESLTKAYLESLSPKPDDDNEEEATGRVK